VYWWEHNTTIFSASHRQYPEEGRKIKVFYLSTDAPENCFKKNIKIYIKTAPTCFSAITIIRERIISAC
jgi:hypothetical protein